VGVWNETAAPADVANGRALGVLVADAIIAWGMADGSLDLSPSVVLPEVQPGVWQPTAPAFHAPDTPQWGKVQTVVIGDPATVRAPAPPAWTSAPMRDSYEAFAATQRILTDEDRALARYWAAGEGTVTPPGMWMRIARDLITAYRIATPDAARIYAALSVALHDGAIACWESKYSYWLARPLNAMAETDPTWKPLITTPPHPSYPSGHATFSGAAATVLRAYFPAEAEQLNQWANDAARSRIVAGIHWSIDSEAGLAQGEQVAEKVLTVAGEE
jgi:hypothetical protein